MSDVVNDDFVIYPGIAVFERVPQCTTGRVYALKFKTCKEGYFY